MKKVIVAINKTDNKKANDNIYDFYELGFDYYIPISGTHNIGMDDLMDEVTKDFNKKQYTKILRKHILTHEAKQTEFDCCMIHWESIQLKDGKLFLCPIQAYIDIFNDYFNENFVVKDGDILDIYDDSVTDETICNFYTHKNDFCKYCRKPIENIEWEKSKKDKNEWME